MDTLAGDLTRAQLIKALYCCSGASCKQCPLYKKPPDFPVQCFNNVMYYAAELLSIESSPAEAKEVAP